MEVSNTIYFNNEEFRKNAPKYGLKFEGHYRDSLYLGEYFAFTKINDVQLNVTFSLYYLFADTLEKSDDAKLVEAALLKFYTGFPWVRKNVIYKKNKK